MPIEEQAEEKIQNAVQTIITGGAKLMLRIPKGVAMALLRSGMKLTKTGVHAAGEAVKNKIDSGEMSEKRLQRKKDGDLHELQLDDSTMREVQHSLKTASNAPTKASSSCTSPARTKTMSATQCNARSKAWAWTSPTTTSPSSRRNRPETSQNPRRGRPRPNQP